MNIINALKLKPGLNVIVLYDGVCNICNLGIQFVMKRNNALPIVHYASLQSKLGLSLSDYYNLPKDLSTSILLKYHIPNDFLQSYNTSSSIPNNSSLNLSHLNDDSLNEAAQLPQPELFMKSDASIELVRYLDNPWPITYYIAKIIPKSLRDGIYDRFARGRYQYFGKTDSCQMPKPGN
ncbi:8232_t:CDS:2 [Funneliformis geosporum]|uniref:13519_t:CDS:1 n=1 Tax=Funneliformis geosporum TaxID=1117311 RepID=A0A9W4SGG4_9GLOM|nr:8232_t:CDS:2 [Funneliformis geosporum]CAI2168010.1 13519_t:CDS:2 [Funneliformis geosporum]